MITTGDKIRATMARNGTSSNGFRARGAAAKKPERRLHHSAALRAKKRPVSLATVKLPDDNDPA